MKIFLVEFGITFRTFEFIFFSEILYFAIISLMFSFDPVLSGKLLTLSLNEEYLYLYLIKYPCPQYSTRRNLIQLDNFNLCIWPQLRNIIAKAFKKLQRVPITPSDYLYTY